MQTPILGPNPDLILPEEKLFGLPANWMVAACMESSFRRLTGWLGLAQAPSSTRRAFTCRIKAREGVYGLLPLSGKPGEKATVHYRLFYFPALEEDPALDEISIPAMIALCDENLETLIRDFPSYPDFADTFAIADMHLVLTHPAHEIALSLSAPTYRRMISEKGVQTEEGAWLVEAGGYEENLPAFALAKDLFTVLAAGLSASLGQPPETYLAQKDEAFLLTRKEDGTVEKSKNDDIYLRTEALLWATDLASDWPKAQDYKDEEMARLLRVACGQEALNKEEETLLRLPHLVVLSGFLGSGKTSFLNQFIEFHLAQNQQVAVIQNELGETGVDENLLEGDDSVIALDAGCVCCTLAGSLTRALRQITDKIAPEVIVLETTGLANPLNMIEEFEELSDLALLSSIVAVVDASCFWSNLEASDVVGEQIRAADTIILNKCDLIDEVEREKIEEEILKRHPDTKIIHATHGRVNPNALGAQFLRPAKEEATSCCCAGGHACHNHTHDHGHHELEHGFVTHLDEGFSALKFSLSEEIDADQLLSILKQTPANILRVKGLASLAGTEKPQVIQYASGRAAFEPAARQTNTPPFLLIIGKDLDPEALKKLWLPLLKD